MVGVMCNVADANCLELGSESRIGPVGSFTLLRPPERGTAGHGLAVSAQVCHEPAQTATGFALNLHSFSTVCGGPGIRVELLPTLWMPRSRNSPEAIPNMFGKPVDRLSDDLVDVHTPPVAEASASLDRMIIGAQLLV